MKFDLTKPLCDPDFRRAYRKEALTISKVIPALCRNSTTALMALLTATASVVLATGIPAAEARKIMIDAVNLIFDAWEKNGEGLASMEPKGEG